MNITEYFQSPVSIRLGVSLAHFLWQGLLIAFVAQSLMYLLAKNSSRIRYGLYMTSLIVMVLALGITYSIIDAPPSSKLPEPVTTNINSESPLSVLETEYAFPAESEATESPVSESMHTIPETSPLTENKESPQPWNWKQLVPYATGFYCIGVFLMIVRLFLGLQGGQKLRKSSKPVEDTGILTALSQQARALGLTITPAIACCKRIMVPTVVGVLKPTILIPFSFTSGLNFEQVEMLLAHELAHIRRYDPLLNVIQRMIEALLFFHPAVWFISRRIRIERENCCDDLVLKAGGIATTYASSLLEVAQKTLLAASQRTLSVEGVAAINKPSQLRSRIVRILGSNSNPHIRLKRPWILVTVLVIATLFALSFYSNPESISKESQPSDEQLQRIHESIYVLRHHILTSRTKQWTSAIQELVEIGKPAVPELVYELDRTKEDSPLRAIAFTLRAIEDPRAVPALIRAFPRAKIFSSDFGLYVLDPKLQSFMTANQIDPTEKDEYPSFSYGRAVRQIDTALEKITGHQEWEPIRFRGGFRSDEIEKVEAVRKNRKQTAQRWQTWWSKNWSRFLTKQELASVEIRPRKDDPVEKAGLAKYFPIFPAGKDLRLGPVRNIFLPPSIKASNKAWFDLDQGKQYHKLEGFQSTGKSYDCELWFEQVGIDLQSVPYIFSNNVHYYALSGMNTHFWQIDNSRWDTLGNELKGDQPLDMGIIGPVMDPEPRSPETRRVVYTKESLPATFLFTTRDGGKGILQVRESSTDPPGVRFRYRLVEKLNKITDDSVLLRLIDPDGQPVEGAKVGTSVRTRDKRVLNSRLYWRLRNHKKNITNERGEIVLTRPKLFLDHWPPEHKVALYILHEERMLGAFCEIGRNDTPREVSLTLEPVCHVHGKLACTFLEKMNRPLTWTDVYLKWTPDSFGVLQDSTRNRQFDFFVPAGQYQLSAHGSSDSTSTQGVHPDIEIRPGQTELDLGVIDLPPTKVTALIGKDAPELGPIQAWKNGDPVKLSDLRGKVVILHFGGRYPSVSHNLPELVELHEQFSRFGLVIIALYNCSSMQELETRFIERVKKYGGVNVTDIPFRLAVDGGKPTFYEITKRERLGATYGIYDITMYSTTVLIDQQGKVLGRLPVSRAKGELQKLLGVSPKESEKSAWRKRFYEVYRLEEGQIIKRIAPPFIPERKNYYAVEHTNQAKAIPEPPDYFTFHWDGKLNNWGLGFSGGKGRTLKTILDEINIANYEIEGPDEFLNLRISGDWIIRNQAPLQDKINALVKIIADEFNRSVRFEKRTVEREVIVARGKFHFHRPSGTYDNEHVHFYSDTLDEDEGAGGGGADSISEFLHTLGWLTELRVINETQPPQEIIIPYSHHRSAYLYKVKEEAKRTGKLKLLLENITRQTELQFYLETRPVEIWLISEKR